MAEVAALLRSGVAFNELLGGKGRERDEQKHNACDSLDAPATRNAAVMRADSGSH
jgi:hypothetical protein